MTTAEITNGWALELEDGFERRVEAGDLVLWKGGRTVYASVFETSNAEVEEAIAAMIERRRETPVRTFDRVGAGLAGHAYLLPEGGGDDGDGEYWGLNTWTASKTSVACVTFYFADIRDLPWAVRAWESVRCGACGPRYVN
jgi:hypothetical protein